MSSPINRLSPVRLYYEWDIGEKPPIDSFKNDPAQYLLSNFASLANEGESLAKRKCTEHEKYYFPENQLMALALKKWVKNGSLDEKKARIAASDAILKVSEEGNDTLNLEGLGLSSLPDVIRYLSIRHLQLGNNNLYGIPSWIKEVKELRELDISNNKIVDLPKEISELKNLQSLKFQNNPIVFLPKELDAFKDQLYCQPKKASEERNLLHISIGLRRWVGEAEEIERKVRIDAAFRIFSAFDTKNECLDLERLQLLSSLPEEIRYLTSLKYLRLIENRIKEIPSWIGELKDLYTLDVSYNKIESLPEGISGLTNLQELYINNNKLKKLPNSIGNLTSLEEVFFQENNLVALPKSVGNWLNITNVDFSDNQMSYLPDSVGNWVKLERINFCNNKLRRLPDGISNWTKVGELFFQCNEIEELPLSISTWNAHTLDLNGNRLTTIPKEIVEMPNLTDLDLSSNPIVSLPLEFNDISLSDFDIDEECWLNPNCTESLTSLMAFMPQDMIDNGEFREALELSFEDRLRSWMGLDEYGPFPDEHKLLLSPPDKAVFSLFLKKLENTRDYANKPEAFSLRIMTLLSMASEDETCADKFFNQLPEAAASCGDRVTFYLDEMELAVRAALAGDMDDASFAVFLLRQACLKIVDSEADRYLTGVQHPEEIEVKLWFRLKLREFLPISSESMYFESTAEIPEEFKPRLIREAKQKVWEKIDTLEKKAMLLCEEDLWKERLKKSDAFQSYQKVIDAKTEELTETLFGTDQEGVNAWDGLKAQREVAFLDATLQLLRQWLESPPPQDSEMRDKTPPIDRM